MGTPLLDRMVQLLRGSALLDVLPEKELRDLATRVHRSRHDAGDLLFRKGDEGRGMMVVVSGRVKIASVGESGSELALNWIEPGEVFGEMSLLDGEPRSTDAVASRPTELISVDRRDFLPVLSRNPDAALKMMQVLSRRIRQTTQFAELTVFMPVSERLLTLLRRLVEGYGREDPKSGVTRVDHGFTQQELADSLGVTRVSINRQLGAWEEQGLIRKGRGWMEIPDLARLEEFVLDAGSSHGESPSTAC